MPAKTHHNPGLRITLIGDAPRLLVQTRSWSVQLEPVVGEEGSFHAFSETRKRCVACNAQFTRKAVVECPRCKVALEPLAYLIDLAWNGGRGKCTCKSHECNKRDEQGDESFACCKHAGAAFAALGYMRAVKLAGNERPSSPTAGGGSGGAQRKD